MVRKEEETYRTSKIMMIKRARLIDTISVMNNISRTEINILRDNATGILWLFVCVVKMGSDYLKHCQPIRRMEDIFGGITHITSTLTNK